MKFLITLLFLLSTLAFSIDKKTPTGGTVKDKPGQSQGTVIPEPSSMSNAQATKLGLKQYYCDTTGGPYDITYNNSTKATISGSSVSGTYRCLIIPYQMQDGAWRAKLSFNLNTSGNINNFSVNGLFPKNMSTWYQMGICGDGSQGTSGQIKPNIGTPGNFYVNNYAGAGIGSVGCYLDFELNSKPTWAY